MKFKHYKKTGEELNSLPMLQVIAHLDKILKEIHKLTYVNSLEVIMNLLVGLDFPLAQQILIKYFTEQYSFIKKPFELIDVLFKYVFQVRDEHLLSFIQPIKDCVDDVHIKKAIKLSSQSKKKSDFLDSILKKQKIELNKKAMIKARSDSRKKDQVNGLKTQSQLFIQKKIYRKPQKKISHQKERKPQKNLSHQKERKQIKRNSLVKFSKQNSSSDLNSIDLNKQIDTRQRLTKIHAQINHFVNYFGIQLYQLGYLKYQRHPEFLQIYADKFRSIFQIEDIYTLLKNPDSPLTIFVQDRFDTVTNILMNDKRTMTLADLGYKQSSVYLIDQASKAKNAINQFRKAERLGFDTQFSQGNKLSLLQIATEKSIYIFDMLFQFPKQIISELQEILSNDKLWIGHSISNDQRVLSKVFSKIKFRNRFDTQQFVKNNSICGEGLRNVVLYYFKKDLCKLFQNTDWQRRPLLKSMVHYAAMDAGVCLKLYSQMVQQCLQSQSKLVNFNAIQVPMTAYYKNLRVAINHMDAVKCLRSHGFTAYDYTYFKNRIKNKQYTFVVLLTNSRKQYEGYKRVCPVLFKEDYSPRTLVKQFLSIFENEINQQTCQKVCSQLNRCGVCAGLEWLRQ